ncbi:hypothetical protein pb186bvf_019021 [Paramecium bursaria]
MISIRFQAFWTQSLLKEFINRNTTISELENQLSKKYFKCVTIEHISGIFINKSFSIDKLGLQDGQILKLSEKKAVVQPIINNEKLEYTLDLALDSSIEEAIAFLQQEIQLTDIIKVEVYSNKQLLTDDQRMQFINLGNYDTYDLLITTNERKLTALQTLEQFKVFEEFAIFSDIEGNFVCYKFYKPYASGILYKHKGIQGKKNNAYIIKLNDLISISPFLGGFRVFWNNNTTSSVKIQVKG